MKRALPAPSGDAVDQGVSDPFGGEQKKGQDRKRNLKTLGVEFFLRDGLQAPLRGRLAAQVSHFPDYKQVEDGSEEGQNHHGDANGILMEAVGRCVNACGCGESAEADGYAQTADGNDGSAGALQHGEDDAGPIEDLGVDEQRH